MRLVIFLFFVSINALNAAEYEFCASDIEAYGKKALQMESWLVSTVSQMVRVEYYVRGYKKEHAVGFLLGLDTKGYDKLLLVNPVAFRFIPHWQNIRSRFEITQIEKRYITQIQVDKSGAARIRSQQIKQMVERFHPDNFSIYAHLSGDRGVFHFNLYRRRCVGESWPANGIGSKEYYYIDDDNGDILSLD